MSNNSPSPDHHLTPSAKGKETMSTTNPDSTSSEHNTSPNPAPAATTQVASDQTKRSRKAPFNRVFKEDVALYMWCRVSKPVNWPDIVAKYAEITVKKSESTLRYRAKLIRGPMDQVNPSMAVLQAIVKDNNFELLGKLDDAVFHDGDYAPLRVQTVPKQSDETHGSDTPGNKRSSPAVGKTNGDVDLGRSMLGPKRRKTDQGVAAEVVDPHSYGSYQPTQPQQTGRSSFFEATNDQQTYGSAAHPAAPQSAPNIRPTNSATGGVYSSPSSSGPMQGSMHPQPAAIPSIETQHEEAANGEIPENEASADGDIPEEDETNHHPYIGGKSLLVSHAAHHIQERASHEFADHEEEDFDHEEEDFDHEEEDFDHEEEDFDHKEASLTPFTDADMVHFIFEIQRRQLTAEDIDSGLKIDEQEWKLCAPIVHYDNQTKAYDQAALEVAMDRGTAIYQVDMDYKITKTYTGNQPLWEKTCPGGVVQVRVVRRALTTHDGVFPTRKSGWIDTLVYLVKQVKSEGSMTIKIDGDEVFSDLGLANNAAMEQFMELTFRPSTGSSRLEDIAEEKKDHKKQILAECGDLEEDELFDQKKRMGDLHVRVYVKPARLTGPRNV